jgi:hypothetical protein
LPDKQSAVSLIHGDCLEELKRLPENSVDAVVTDPPYGLSFMGRRWDYGVPSVAAWQEVFRVLKPGGHVLSFGGTRTYHRLVCAIEDAGFEVRDQVGWCFGSGFPKSHNLPGGLGTALKPAWEPICVARKPLEGTVADNVSRWGTGALNIDGCRVGSDTIKVNGWKCGGEQVYNGRQSEGFDGGSHQGRWPANLIWSRDEEEFELKSNISGAQRKALYKWLYENTEH